MKDYVVELEADHPGFHDPAVPAAPGPDREPGAAHYRGRGAPSVVEYTDHRKGDLGHRLRPADLALSDPRLPGVQCGRSAISATPPTGSRSSRT